MSTFRSKMNNVIVTTTIQPPTDAIRKFDALKGWHLIVVGDLKTPRNYRLKRGCYFSPRAQEKYNRRLSDLIGWNTHARRNLGHLLAADLGAQVVAMVDDDNIPLAHWGKDLLVGADARVRFYRTRAAAFDPIGATNYPHLWHRGFPLQLVETRAYRAVTHKTVRVDVQADFWNGDPDVDAIARIAYRPACTFSRDVFPFASDKPSPFNSQNTFVSRRALPYCFVLPFVSPRGREGDIWMAYHMCAMGFTVVYQRPSVRQERNAHDLMADMRDEMVGYRRNIDIVTAIGDGTYRKEHFWPIRARRAFEAYRRSFKDLSHAVS